MRAELVQGHFGLGWVTENSFPFTFIREINETDQAPLMNPSVMITEISQVCLLFYLFPWTVCLGEMTFLLLLPVDSYLCLLHKSGDPRF